MVRSRVRALVVLFGCVLMVARPAAAHPIHSTLTEITRRPGVVLVRIRAFADDFSAAASRLSGVAPGAGHTVSDAAAARYVTRFVRLEGEGGTGVRLTLTGQRREGDVVWVELAGATPLGLEDLRIANAMLFDLHPDQINVVQTAQAGVSRTVLFTAGDGLKRMF